MRRLRRIATGIAGFQRTNDSLYLLIARVPDKLMESLSWREQHLLSPSFRKHDRLSHLQGAK